MHTKWAIDHHSAIRFLDVPVDNSERMKFIFSDGIKFKAKLLNDMKSLVLITEWIFNVPKRAMHRKGITCFHMKFLPRMNQLRDF